MADVLDQRPSSEPDFCMRIRKEEKKKKGRKKIRMQNLALMKALGPKRLPFIQIINISVDYTKENNRGNARLDYIIS